MELDSHRMEPFTWPPYQQPHSVQPFHDSYKYEHSRHETECQIQPPEVVSPISRVKHASCIASASAEPVLATQRGSELINSRPHVLIRPGRNKHLTQRLNASAETPQGWAQTSFGDDMHFPEVSLATWAPSVTIQPRAKQRLGHSGSRSNLNALPI